MFQFTIDQLNPCLVFWPEGTEIVVSTQSKKISVTKQKSSYQKPRRYRAERQSSNGYFLQNETRAYRCCPFTITCPPLSPRTLSRQVTLLTGRFCGLFVYCMTFAWYFFSFGLRCVAVDRNGLEAAPSSSYYLCGVSFT